MSTKGTSGKVIRPGKYSDGQDRDGTPKKNDHGRIAKSMSYLDPAAKAYRASLRYSPYPGGKR